MRKNEKWCKNEEEVKMIKSDDEVDKKRIKKGNNYDKENEDF